jgi:hypothetical protein
VSDQPEAERPAAAEATGNSRVRALWWDGAFALCTLVVVAIRFVILRRGGAPPTIDAGNWLAFGDQILGHGVRSSTIVYPPLVPLLSKPFVSLFGLTNGVALLGSLSSAAPAVGLFISLRWLEFRRAALLPALLVLGASSVGEATAWGGFPQLIGLGLAPVALVLFDRLLRTWQWRHALVSGLAFMAVLATSHLISLIVGAAAVALVVLTLTQSVRAPASWGRRVTALVLLAVPSVWLIPLYWSLAATTSFGAAEPFSPNRLTWSNLLGPIEFLYRDSPWLWRILLPLAIIAPPSLWRRWREPLWRVTSALLVATVLATAITREGRFLYLLTPIAALGVGLWTTRGVKALQTGVRTASKPARSLHPIAVAGLALLMAGVAFQFVRSTQFFGQQRQHYGILTPELVDGIVYLAELTERQDTVAVTSLANAPLGWWVEAIAQRPTIYGSPLGWLAFDDEIRRASVANDLFVPPFPTAEKIESAKNNGIHLILVPTSWTFYDAEVVDSLARQAPDVVLHLNSSAIVIRPDLLDS